MKITPNQLQAMRDWVSDCQWEDEVEGLDDIEVIDGVARHYIGGIAGFIRDFNN